MSDILALVSRGVRMGRNLAFDLRNGGLLRGRVGGSREGSSDTVNTDVTALDRIFHGRIADDDVLVDVGCGKGRVLLWWARRRPGNRIVGLELSVRVATETRKRVAAYPNISVITGDAVALVPPEGTLLFLYNPFGEQTMRAFTVRLDELAAAGSRPTLLYYNPLHAAVFRADPAWVVEDVTIGGADYHALCVITRAHDAVPITAERNRSASTG
jgi:SAM-dependent methyltransferase